MTVESVVRSASSLPDLRKNEKFINTMLPINYFSPWTERPNGPPRRTAFIFRYCSAKPEIAAMPRWASQLIWQVAHECQASPREIEAALFMWGYNVAEEPED